MAAQLIGGNWEFGGPSKEDRMFLVVGHFIFRGTKSREQNGGYLFCSLERPMCTCTFAFGHIIREKTLQIKEVLKIISKRQVRRELSQSTER